MGRRISYIELNRKFKELCAPYTAEDVTKTGRNDEIVSKRREIAIALFGMGYNKNEIAHVMDMNHSSIVHMLKGINASS